MDLQFCKFFAEIHADPTKKITGLKVRDVIALKAHLQECPSCDTMVEEILARTDIKSDPNSEWNKTRYN